MLRPEPAREAPAPRDDIMSRRAKDDTRDGVDSELTQG
jgi:hypothetical protein